MTNKVAILQSNYIPWKGYFDQIASVDHFVLYDDVQYTRRDWRNRNKIKFAQGTKWITIPVQVKGQYFQKIKDTKVVDGSWTEEHWLAIRHAYARAPQFQAVESFLQDLYARAAQLEYLSEVNFLFLDAICKFLDIKTKLHWSSDFELLEGKSERLLSVCQQLNATEYVSGPAAKDYLDESIFNAAGISVSWFDYSGYDEYPQLYPPFDHFVSIVDLLCNTGKEAKNHMKCGAASDYLSKTAIPNPVLP